MQIYQPTVTGSLTVITGSSVELRVTNTGVNIGSVVTDTHTLTGSLNISGSIVGYTQDSQTGSFYRLVLSQALGPGDGNIDINSTILQTVLTKSIPGIQAGDSIEAEFWYTINSSGTPTVTYEATLGPYSQSYTAATSITTGETIHNHKVLYYVSSSAFTSIYSYLDYSNDTTPGTMVSVGTLARAVNKMFNSSSLNTTGTQTFTLKARVVATVTTVGLRLRGYKIALIKRN